MRRRTKRLRGEDEKQEDPFDKKEKKKIMVEEKLRYTEEGEGMKMKKIKDVGKKAKRKG